MVRILPFQGRDAGSSPVGGTQASRVIFVAFGSWHGVMSIFVMVTIKPFVTSGSGLPMFSWVAAILIPVTQWIE